MYKHLVVALVLALALPAMAARAPLGARTGPPPGEHVVLCKITGMIDDGVAVIVERAVKESGRASALIFQIDTPGGLVDSAMEITRHILEAPCPTIAFVDTFDEGMGAISAGALISYSCDHIIMSEAANIGASTPYSPAAQGSEMVTEKSMSFLRAKYRSLAEMKGHNPYLGEGMVDNQIELWGDRQEDGTYVIYKVRSDTVVGAKESKPASSDPLGDLFKELQEQTPINLDPLENALREAKDDEEAPPESPAVDRSAIPKTAKLISPAGELVTLTANDATDFGLCPKVVRSLDEVLTQYDLEGKPIYEVIPTWSEALFGFLTNPLIVSLLLLAGVGGIYFEVRTPGFGLPGIVAVVALGLFFGAQYTVGLAEWLDILLVLVGVGLIGLEIFVLPGFGIAGVAGGFCMVAGFYLAMTRVVIPQYDWEFARLADAGQTVAVTAVLFTVVAILSWRYLPRTRFFRMLVLEHEELAESGYTVQTEQEESAVGMRGVTTSMLRPAGRGRFEGKNYDLVTRGEFIAKGRPVRIIQAEGNRYVVVECEEEGSSS